VARATKVVRKVKKCDQTKGSMRKSAKTEKVCQKLIKCEKKLNNLQVSFPLAFSHLLHQDIGIFEVFIPKVQKDTDDLTVLFRFWDLGL